MKIRFAGMALFLTIVIWAPAHAKQEAIIPAYATVSAYKSLMLQYKNLMDKQNRAAARKLLTSRKVFLVPRDIKVEVVSSTNNIARVRIDQLDRNAKPVTLYYYTLTDQLKFLAKQ